VDDRRGDEHNQKKIRLSFPWRLGSEVPRNSRESQPKNEEQQQPRRKLAEALAIAIRRAPFRQQVRAIGKVEATKDAGLRLCIAAVETTAKVLVSTKKDLFRSQTVECIASFYVKSKHLPTRLAKLGRVPVAVRIPLLEEASWLHCDLHPAMMVGAESVSHPLAAVINKLAEFD
ncbi:hypothetical protein GW17_00051348, partial [Ensete ventricosum]